MGSSYGIRCTECDYEKQFIIGVGMMYSPSNIQDVDSGFQLLPSLIRSKKTLSLVRELIKEKKGRISKEYGHKIFVCNKCGEFYERFAYEVKYESGAFVPEYKCTKCKAVLYEAENIKTDVKECGEAINLPRYHCPKCGKKSLIEDCSSMIMWD